jgi:hypothetical protein
MEYTAIYEHARYLLLSIQAIEREIANSTRALVAMRMGFELSSMLNEEAPSTSTSITIYSATTN